MTQSQVDGVTFAEALRQWQAGQQEPAKSMIRPLADAGNAPAQYLLAWFLHQQGEPGWREAIPYAKAAVRAGYPNAAGLIVGNMVNNADLRREAIEIARLAAAQGVVVLDPFGQAMSFAQQNDTAGVQEMFESPWPLAMPNTPEGWAELVQAARARSSELESTSEALRARAAELEAEWDSSRKKISSQATQLMSFITQATNAEAYQFFEAEAATSKTEAEVTWKFGIGVVIAAAVISLLPLVAHYVNQFFKVGPEFTATQIVSMHVAGGVALGTVAGVLLTRSRVRDRNRQRNTDLSVALRMMFAYAQQIENEVERQQFIQVNGRVVLEAYLHQDGGPTEEGTGGLLGR